MFWLSGPYIRSSAPGPQKILNQFNLLLPKAQSLRSCAHYFQWFMGYLNHVGLLMPHVHVLKKLPHCLMCTQVVLWILSCAQLINTCSKLAMKKLNMFKVKTKYNMTSFWCFYCWLWAESVYQYSASTFNFEQALVSKVWNTSHNVLKTQKVTHLFRSKLCKAYFIQRFIIAPNWNKLWTNDHTMNILQGRRKLFYGGGRG